MVKQPNVLLIVVDALRASNLGCYGYSRPTSPNINALAKEGVLFENAYSCAITTFPSFASIFCGKYPLSHGIIKHRPTSIHQDSKTLDENGVVFLPEILKSKGYVTLAVDWLGGWLRRGYDYYSGFIKPQKVKLYRVFIKRWLRKNVRSSYYSLARRLLGLKPIDDAKSVTDRATELIKRMHKNKFFLFIHYWDPHIPYDPPRQFLQRFTGYDYGNNKTIKDLFDQFDPKYHWYLRMRIPHGSQNTNDVLARYDGEISFVKCVS